MKAEFKKLKAQEARLRLKLYYALRRVPDNPKAKRVGLHAFVLRFKDLGKNWSVDFHDHKAQGRWLAKKILTVGSPMAFLADIVDEGRYWDPEERRTRYFAPEVVKHVVSITDG